MVSVVGTVLNHHGQRFSMPNESNAGCTNLLDFENLGRNLPPASAAFQGYTVPNVGSPHRPARQSRYSTYLIEAPTPACPGDQRSKSGPSSSISRCIVHTSVNRLLHCTYLPTPGQWGTRPANWNWRRSRQQLPSTSSHHTIYREPPHLTACS